MRLRMKAFWLQMNTIAIELQSNQIKNQKDNQINDEQSFSKKHSMNKIKSGFALRGQKLRKPPDKFSPAILSIILTWLVIFCDGQFDLAKTWLASTMSQEQEARTAWFASNMSQEQEVPSGTQNQILDNYPAPQQDTQPNRHSTQPTSLLQQCISAREGEALNSNSIMNNNIELSGTIRWTTSSGLSAYNNSDLACTIWWTTISPFLAHYTNFG